MMKILVATLLVYALGLLFTAVGSRLAGRCTTWCCALLGLPMWVVGGTVAPFCLALPQLMLAFLAAGMSVTALAVGTALAGAVANLGLALAVCLAAGLDGMERKLTPPEEITENIFEMNADERAACGIEDLPDSLEHALDALEADPLMAEVLGPHIYTQYIAGKEKEWEEYCTRVSSWEIAKYMVLY